MPIIPPAPWYHVQLGLRCAHSGWKCKPAGDDGQGMETRRHPWRCLLNEPIHPRTLFPLNCVSFRADRRLRDDSAGCQDGPGPGEGRWGGIGFPCGCADSRSCCGCADSRSWSCQTLLQSVLIPQGIARTAKQWKWTSYEYLFSSPVITITTTTTITYYYYFYYHYQYYYYYCYYDCCDSYHYYH